MHRYHLLRRLHKTADELHREVSELGEDVKVMGARKPDGVQITVAAAVISSRIKNIEEYQKVIEEVEKVVQKLSEFENPEIHVNTADNIEEETVYITETGTSAEMGDDGSVGRGNRVNGLITPNRSMSMEAASGKNPVTHVGKIYDLKASIISGKIFEETGEFTQVKLLSKIGSSIKKPQTAHIETTSNKEDKIENIVEEEIENMEKIREKAVREGLKTF